jgi:AcrR family transcriptional regulator
MHDTKERILLTALRLFAASGYEAVSVSDVAGELGITKGALYRHYRSKRDIFDSIVARMERRDAEQADAHGLPEGTKAEQADAYRCAGIDDTVDFAKSMFRYWTQDEFAAQFRRMLTLEQFRSAEMGALYQQYLVSGPLGYMTDLFAAQGLPRPREEAARFYAPMFLLYSVCDAAADKDAALSLADGLLEDARARLKTIGRPQSVSNETER